MRLRSVCQQHAEASANNVCSSLPKHLTRKSTKSRTARVTVRVQRRVVRLEVCQQRVQARGGRIARARVAQQQRVGAADEVARDGDVDRSLLLVAGDDPQLRGRKAQCSQHPLCPQLCTTFASPKKKTNVCSVAGPQLRVRKAQYLADPLCPQLCPNLLFLKQ